MQRLRSALEKLDEMISALEDKVDLDRNIQFETQKKQLEQLKLSRLRETSLLAVSQKVSSRLDETIQHVERILR